MNYYYVPSALAQDFAANNREAIRDLLLAVSTSDLAVITKPDKPDKIHKLNNNRVLYQVSYPAQATAAARMIVDGNKLAPIIVEAIRFQHLVYYIPIHGNHRSAAVAYLMGNYIQGTIVSTTDISGILFRSGPRNRVLVRTKPRGRSQYTWKITDCTIETGVQRANFSVMGGLQYYDHIRKQELEHEASKNKRN
ncbi:MAG: hypothetical protein DRI46_09680 [Chloroflexi bacterium]|nr:MAG: hypothetical protein DRI46_09680 [Chloroflexota bacterium]